MRDICWQYQIKQKKLEESQSKPKLFFNSIEVKRISYQEANIFIIEYEWLKNIGSAKYCFGLFIDHQLTSVVCYTTPVSPNSYLKLLGINKNEVFQLCRGATIYWAPKWAGSKIIADSLKILNKNYNVKAVVAYADPKAGEIGTIYQATNALYLGLTNPGGAKYYIIKGKKYHPRKLHKLYGTRKKEYLKLIDPDFKTEPIHKKHRYLFLLGSRLNKKSMRKKVNYLIDEYPKRISPKTKIFS